MSMWNLDGWRKVTCNERDAIFATARHPHATSYLPHQRGDFTEWADGHEGDPLLRDYTLGGIHCYHYVATVAEAQP